MAHGRYTLNHGPGFRLWPEARGLKSCSNGAGCEASRKNALLVFVMLWVPPPTPHKSSTTVRACDTNRWEVEAGESAFQSHPGPYSEFKASLGYVRPNLKNSRGTGEMEKHFRVLLLCRWPRFSSQHPHGSSQPPAAQLKGTCWPLPASAGLRRPLLASAGLSRLLYTCECSHMHTFTQVPKRDKLNTKK